MTATAPIRIYIADDHTIVRDGLAVMLQVHSDITVVGSGSGMPTKKPCAFPLNVSRGCPHA